MVRADFVFRDSIEAKIKKAAQPDGLYKDAFDILP
jgi:hypothetical protein